MAVTIINRPLGFARLTAPLTAAQLAALNGIIAAGGPLFKFRQLNDAEIKGGSTTPIEAIAAPGSGKIIMPERMLTRVHIVAGGGYGSARTTSLRWTNSIANGDIMTAQNTVSSTAPNDQVNLASANTTITTSANNLANAQNSPVQAKMSADSTGGNVANTLDLYIWYWIMSVP